MAENDILVHLDLNQQQIKNVAMEPLAADPGSPVEGQVWLNSTNNRFAWFDGAVVKYAATLADLEQFSALVGTHDASGGIPTAGSGDGGAIRAGDRWIVSVAGTIAGIQGGDTLEVGDLIIATADAAAAAANFLAVQTNIDPSGFAGTETLTLASLPANTATSYASALTTVSSVQVWDATGQDITAGLAVDRTNGELESNVALTNLTITTVGIV